MRRVIAAALAGAACAVNPATGKRQLALVSEGQEIAMGRQNDQAIATSLGLYGDSAVQLYVGELGGRLAALSERPQLPWTFRVVDDPVVNAFAVPGGFIYITRGILAHLNSEAQLAAVLGHEIGHITARHSVEQLSRAQLAQLGLGLGMIFSPEFRQVGDLAGAGLNVLFLKFGRDDESQADELGLRYLLRANYDPRPMADVFTMLARVSQGAGAGRVPNWLSTHPDPVNRRESIQRQIAALGQPLEGRGVGEDYLNRLDGLVYGQNPREGFFRDDVFLHPDLAFQIQFPSGWTTANQRQAVMAMSPEQDGLIQVSLAEQPTPEAAARAFFDLRSMDGPPARRTRINELPAVVQEFLAQTEGGQIRGVATFVEHGGRVFRLLAYSRPALWRAWAGVVDEVFDSFARLTDREALNIQPLRVEIVPLPSSMTLTRFMEQYPSPIPIQELALINQVDDVNAQIPAGRLLKRVVRGR
ncbi:MAG: M48 family metalloprotease [Gemmatimonadetes bacterium]|nr:M48 family metalloprotease [Gemmatimonadota bacterium]